MLFKTKTTSNEYVKSTLTSHIQYQEYLKVKGSQHRNNALLDTLSLMTYKFRIRDLGAYLNFQSIESQIPFRNSLA